MKKDDVMKQSWFKPVKAANRELIKEFGGIDAVARFLGCSPALVGLWNNRNAPDVTPYPEMIALEADLGRAILSRAFAVLAGATVTDPSPDGPGAPCIHRAYAAAQGAFSDFTGAYAVAVADGHVDPEEDAAISRKAIAMREQIDRFLSGRDRRASIGIVSSGGAK